MSETMPNIDTSGIEALRKIKEEQDVIKERLDKMESMKEKVSRVVYEKVHQDYSKRLDTLRDEAEPLKAEVREQYGILKSLMDELSAGLAKVTLKREELEFRNDLGEFEEDHYQQEKKKYELDHTQKQAEMDEAEQMREMFLSVFESEEDLEAGLAVNAVEAEPAAAPDGDDEGVEELGSEDLEEPGAEEQGFDDSISGDPGSEEPDPEEPDAYDMGMTGQDAVEAGPGFTDIDEAALAGAVPDDVDDSDGDMMTAGHGLDEDDEDLGEGHADGNDDFEDSLEDAITDELGDSFGGVEETGKAVKPPPIPEHTTDEITKIMDQTEVEREAVVEAGIKPPVSPGYDEGDAGVPPAVGDDPEGTMIISNPKIISLNNAIEGQVIVLGMGTTSVGRSPDNDTHLTEDRVSRKHAQVAFGPGGYAIYDLNSENGTYVNGNRIREHFLSDGDIVMIGSYKFLYRDH